jgi:hypothetical protein
MNNWRAIALSIHKTLDDTLKSGEMMGAAFNVYTESDMRSGTQPTFPFLFLLQFGTSFGVEHLPVIIVQPTFYVRAFEMGSQAVFVDLNLHIFARDSGQGLDLPGGVSTVESFSIYDFSNPQNPVIREVAELIEDGDGVSWKQSHHQLNDDNLALEATLRAWTTMSCNFWVTCF